MPWYDAEGADKIRAAMAGRKYGSFRNPGITVPTDAWQFLPWTPDDTSGGNPEGLFDLSDPLNPVMLADGFVTVTARIYVPLATHPGKSAALELDLDFNDTDPNNLVLFSLDAAADSPLANTSYGVTTLSYFVPRDGVVNAQIYHNAGVDLVNMLFTASVVIEPV